VGLSFVAAVSAASAPALRAPGARGVLSGLEGGGGGAWAPAGAPPAEWRAADHLSLLATGALAGAGAAARGLGGAALGAAAAAAAAAAAPPLALLAPAALPTVLLADVWAFTRLAEPWGLAAAHGVPAGADAGARAALLARAGWGAADAAAARAARAPAPDALAGVPLDAATGGLPAAAPGVEGGGSPAARTLAPPGALLVTAASIAWRFVGNATPAAAQAAEHTFTISSGARCVWWGERAVKRACGGAREASPRSERSERIGGGAGRLMGDGKLMGPRLGPLANRRWRGEINGRRLSVASVSEVATEN
jgi:hypothetical protein